MLWWDSEAHCHQWNTFGIVCNETVFQLHNPETQPLKRSGPMSERHKSVYTEVLDIFHHVAKNRTKIKFKWSSTLNPVVTFRSFSLQNYKFSVGCNFLDLISIPIFWSFWLLLKPFFHSQFFLCSFYFSFWLPSLTVALNILSKLNLLNKRINLYIQLNRERERENKQTGSFLASFRSPQHFPALFKGQLWQCNLSVNSDWPVDCCSYLTKWTSLSELLQTTEGQSAQITFILWSWEHFLLSR